MYKLVILLALFGAASAGNLNDAIRQAYNAQIEADAIALNRNLVAQEAGAQAGIVRDSAAINNAIVIVAARAEEAALRDQEALIRAVATLDIINRDGAIRDAVAQAAIRDYAAARDATIQAQQLQIARYANRVITDPFGYGVPAPVAYGPGPAVQSVAVGPSVVAPAAAYAGGPGVAFGPGPVAQGIAYGAAPIAQAVAVAPVPGARAGPRGQGIVYRSRPLGFGYTGIPATTAFRIGGRRGRRYRVPVAAIRGTGNYNIGYGLQGA